MKRQYLRIGEFAKLAHVSVQTLRHYAEKRLLTPSVVDEASGYRYYALTQLTELHRVQALKDLGLSLGQIRELLAEGFSEGDLRAMLRLKRLELQTQLEEQQAQLHRVEARLALLGGPSSVDLKNVVLKSVSSQSVIATRGKLEHIGEITGLFTKLDKYLERHGVSPAGACLAIIDVPDTRLTTRVYEVEVATPVSVPLSENTEIVGKTLKALPLAASLLHHGDYGTLHESYQELHDWISLNRYRVTGAAREVYLRMCDVVTLYPEVYLTKAPDDYLTEVQLPVAKAHEA